MVLSKSFTLFEIFLDFLGILKKCFLKVHLNFEIVSIEFSLVVRNDFMDA